MPSIASRINLLMSTLSEIGSATAAMGIVVGRHLVGVKTVRTVAGEGLGSEWLHQPRTLWIKPIVVGVKKCRC